MGYRMMSLLCVLTMLMCAAVSPASAAGPADAVETVGPGSINWTSGEVYATGVGAPPPNAANPAQARAMDRDRGPARDRATAVGRA